MSRGSCVEGWNHVGHPVGHVKETLGMTKKMCVRSFCKTLASFSTEKMPEDVRPTNVTIYYYIFLVFSALLHVSFFLCHASLWPTYSKDCEISVSSFKQSTCQMTF